MEAATEAGKVEVVLVEALAEGRGVAVKVEEMAAEAG